MIVGALKCRPPGMRINLIPLYAWYVLVAAAMILFAFPPLIAGSLLLEIERAFHWPFFDPARGGDPLLVAAPVLALRPPGGLHHLPAVGRADRDDRADVRAQADRRLQLDRAGGGRHRLPELRAVGASHVHHRAAGHLARACSRPPRRRWRSRPACRSSAFSPRSLAGRVVRSVPMLFAFGSLVIFVLGGLTGVMVALAPFDFQAHDTFFVVGHLHYVLIGGALFPILAGCYYFFPLVNGKKLSDRLGKIAFWLTFIGFNVAFLPMHLTGLRGMPRRVFTYPAELGFDALNLISTIGAFILAAGVAVVVWDLVRPKRKQPYAERNPWGAGTLEWLQEMPGKPWGIRSIPEIDSRYPAVGPAELHARRRRGPVLPARRRRREAGNDDHLASSTRSREQCLRLPGSTFITLWAALTTGGFFIFGTFHCGGRRWPEPARWRSASSSTGCGPGRRSFRRRRRRTSALA